MKIDSSRLHNIFDQYSVEENRITNAFLQTLAHDETLLKTFLVKYLGVRINNNSSIFISAQKRPFDIGDIEEQTDEVEGIPDGWIIIDDDKAIVFEAKIAKNAIRNDQLSGHTRKLRGYTEKYLCVITPDEESPVENIQISGVSKPVWVSWRQIYQLVNNQKKRTSAVAHYLRKELKEFLAMKEDLIGFQGINYSADSFNRREAIVILKSLIKEIKPSILEVYPKLQHERKSYSQDIHAYTVFHRSTWSFLAADENFTRDIHLTFWLTETHMGMGVTVPNNAQKGWRRLKKIFKKDDLFDSFVDKLFELRRVLPNLYLEFVHRHYLRQRDGIIDGIMEMDLDTVKGSKKVKANERWLAVLRELIKYKKDYNGQFMLRARFFYNDYPEIKTHAFKNTVIKTANSFKDIYDCLQET